MPLGPPDYDTEDPVISIGTLSKKVGLSVSTVRHYESEGLIIPFRDDSGRRLFSLEDVFRLQNIQHLIQDLGLNIEGIRRMQALLPCWDLFRCKKKTRDKCPAFQSRERPCWTIKGLPCSPQGNECRKCIVYRFGSQCTEDIKLLLYDQYHSEDAGAAISELLKRKRQ
ncbi:MAG: MerR family transcriptional regulator [Planctomycetota bacterium]|nr:MAG: MerR family transcriptional regulator [Planctomycetota bacterium]